MVTGGGYTCQYHWYSLITIGETTGMAPQAPRSPERAAASKCGTIIQDLVVDTTDFADKKLSAICAAETAVRQLVQEMRAYLNRHGPSSCPGLRPRISKRSGCTPGARP
jgi:hypothetical protein